MNEISKSLHIAKVINNNDPNKDGLIQISIPYMHTDIKNDFLPWALPFHNFLGGSSSHGISAIPENNSYVWVFFEDEEQHKNPFYMGNVNNEDYNPAVLFQDNVKATIGAEGVYPNVKFIYFPNGICIGCTSIANMPEIFIYHPKMYIFVDKTGYTYNKHIYDNLVQFDHNGLRIKDTNNNEIISNGTKLVINTILEISQ